MGLSLFKSCYTNSSCYSVPNPNPSNYEILDRFFYKNATLLVIKYLDCTNFEGVKILVYKGKFTPRSGQELDPHFEQGDNSPIARFKPDEEGKRNAINFASNY